MKKPTPVTAAVEEIAPNVPFHHAPQREYTCLLTTTVQLDLSAEVKDSLSDAFKRTCETNRWGLEFLTIEQRYVHLGIRAQDTVPAAQLMGVVRAGTAHIGRGKLWALGHLVVRGIHRHLPQTVERFLKLAQRQGV